MSPSTSPPMLDISEPQSRAATRPLLSVIVPVHNERDTLSTVVERLKAVDFGVVVELLLVNDGSNDGSREVLEGFRGDERIRVFHHSTNGGKGAAVQTGLEHSRGTYVVVQDADMELDPAELRGLLEMAVASPGSACYGSRFLGDNRRFRGMPTYWANRLLTLICNLLAGLSLSDMNTCYKLMPTTTARRLHLTSRGFSMEPEITIKLARLRVPILEKPVTYRPRDVRAGKKIRVTDFFRYLRAMAVYRWNKFDAS